MILLGKVVVAKQKRRLTQDHYYFINITNDSSSSSHKPQPVSYLNHIITSVLSRRRSCRTSLTPLSINSRKYLLTTSYSLRR